MQSIVLTDDQARVLAAANGPVELRDERGAILARVNVPNQDEIAEARRSLASDQPRWKATQVEALLARLTEIRAHEGMDETKLRHFLTRFRAGETI
jgi:hypothetical protein